MSPGLPWTKPVWNSLLDFFPESVIFSACCLSATQLSSLSSSFPQLSLKSKTLSSHYPILAWKWMVEKEFIYFGQISIFLSLKYILLYFYVYIKKGSNGKIKVFKYRHVECWPSSYFYNVEGIHTSLESGSRTFLNKI